MSVELTIVCNGCGAVGGGSMTSASDVRSQLREKGWSVNRPGGEDLCDTCKPQRRSSGSYPTSEAGR